MKLKLVLCCGSLFDDGEKERGREGQGKREKERDGDRERNVIFACKKKINQSESLALFPPVFSKNFSVFSAHSWDFSSCIQ